MTAGTRQDWGSAYAAGILAGASEAAAEHPLDTIKTRLQAGVPVGRPLSWLAGISPAAWRGVGQGGVFYGANDTIKTALGASNDKPFAVEFVAASVMTAAVETLLFCPLETVKVHLQMDGGLPATKTRTKRTTRTTAVHPGAVRGQTSLPPPPQQQQTAMQCARRLGWGGLTMGLQPLFASHAMANVVFFTSYNALRNRLGDGATGGGAGGALDRSMPGATALAGGVTSCAYTIAGHPMDTVATHIMAQQRPRQRYASTMHCLSSLVRTHGALSLWRGVLPAALSSIPGGAAAMVAFEWAMSASQ